MIDTDKDGRIRVPEIIAAAKWATSLLKNPDDLLKGSPALPLAAINDAMPEGRTSSLGAAQFSPILGKADAATIDLEDIADTARIFAATNFNGDGIITADAAERRSDEGRHHRHHGLPGRGNRPQRQARHRPGESGQFFAEAQAYSNWWKQAEGDKDILPLGEATAAAAAAVKAVKAKVDDFFTRCRLAAFDPRAIAALNREEKEYLALAAKDLTDHRRRNRRLPAGANRRRTSRCRWSRASIPPGRGALAAFQDDAVKPLARRQRIR